MPDGREGGPRWTGAVDAVLTSLIVDADAEIEAVGGGGAVLNDVGPSLPCPPAPPLLLEGIGPFMLEVGRKVSLPFVLELALIDPG